MAKFIGDAMVGVKGFLMGAANVIPGVSGGTIALITGIYGRIIGSLNAFASPSTWKLLFTRRWKEFWQAIDGRFLLALGAGVVLSILSLAKLMEYVLSHYPIQTWAFFFGLIIASAVIMFRSIRHWSVKDVLFALAGIAIGVAVCTLTPTQTPDSLLFVFLCGAIAVCSMILPGISGSFVLVIMGKYDYIMQALDVTAFNIPVVAVFALGCGVGILAFAKFLHWLLGRWEQQTMLVLLGFIIGSLIKVWPWANMDAIEASQGVAPGAPVEMHIAAAIIWCVVGIAFIAGIELLGSKKKLEKQ